MSEISIERAERILKRYRPGVCLKFVPGATSSFRCRAVIGSVTFCATSSWQKLCNLAIEAWLCEDEVRKIRHESRVIYGPVPDDEQYVNRCCICLPSPRSGFFVMIASNRTWPLALKEFKRNINCVKTPQ